MSTVNAHSPLLPAALTPDMSQLRERAGAQIYYRNFDYLRLFLAIEVVTGHLWAGVMGPADLWIPIPAVAAFVGLSGFLIPQSVERSRNLWHFAWKRALRTIPALIVLLVAILMVFGKKRAVGAMIQYLTAGYCGQFLGVTLPLWSLIVEDALYGCLAMLFAFGLHRKIWLTLPIVACLLVGEAYVGDAMTVYRLFDTSVAFFIGNLVCIFHERLRRLHWLVPAAVVVASLLGWLDFLGRAGLPVLIASVLVLAITLPQIRLEIPDLSYGVYIWHGPIMLALLAKFGMDRAMPWVIATSLITLIVAALSWYLVEERSLRFKNYQLPRWRVLAPAHPPAAEMDPRKAA